MKPACKNCEHRESLHTGDSHLCDAPWCGCLGYRSTADTAVELEAENARLQAALKEVLESRDNMAADILRLQERVEEARHRLAEANEAQREIEAACLRARKERDNARSHSKRLNTLHNAEKVELVRYKARVEEAEEQVQIATAAGLQAVQDRDRYKALAERRKEALEEVLPKLGLHIDAAIAEVVRAAIEEKP